MKGKLIRGLIGLVSLLPLWLSRWLGAVLGRLCWCVQTRESCTTRINIDYCFPELDEAERERLARDSMIEWGKLVFEIPVVWRRSAIWLRRHILAESGEELWQQLKNQNKGIIALGPHLGNWEVAGLEMSLRLPMTTLYAPSGNAALDKQVRRVRSKVGAELVPTSKRGVLALIKALQAGEMVGILPDQEPDYSSGQFAPFFGAPALTMTLIHNLIKRTGARVIFSYAKRISGGFEMVFVEPDSAIYSADAAESVAALNRGVEACVQGAVNQYQWEYKRFKKCPPGVEQIYKKGC